MRPLRLLFCALVLAIGAAVAGAQEIRDEVFSRLTPAQRENLWQSMSPQQKMELWRRLTPEQKQAIRERLTPEQRDAIRQRMIEERNRRADAGPRPDAGGSAVDVAPGGAPFGPRRLSPEERQKLREQIHESTRDLRSEAQAQRWRERRIERRTARER